MTRPQIIRADTIDLQEKAAPSAQDHSRQPTHPAAIGAGRPAPHQAEALREVAVETEEEIHRSPRVSTDWANVNVDGIGIDQQSNDDKRDPGSARSANSQQQEQLNGAQNGALAGATGEDAEMADAEGDDGLEDDDMMDKISSSPSIDDGGYPLSNMWPERVDSLSSGLSSFASPVPSELVGRSSSPFVETPDHFPLSFPSPTYDPGQAETDGPYPFRRTEYSFGSLLVETGADEGSGADSILSFDLSGNFIESYDNDFELPLLEDDDPVVQGESVTDDSLDSVEEDDVITFPYYESSDEDDDEYDFPYPEDYRFVDSGWGGECLQDTEDIDFEFVYALHTFVATVEGQANATKGDTMVLLDDSNSYWWLVRVVKDSSIGYLPAEHIETPTERLARLNKHRNIDLSATMLGDQAEKSKNPLKKAIRRRNAKTVTFSAPTYVEASEIDYSSGEEESPDGDYISSDLQQSENGRANSEEDDSTQIEPSSDKAEAKDNSLTSDDAARVSSETASKASSETLRASDELNEGRIESKSRNGTVRNTDSFFKDETVETRKITITPNLLRDDSSTSTRTSNDSKEIRQRPSFDKIEKDLVSEKSKEDRKKKDKKEKDKKSGMLSGLFKRKDKKSKSQDEDMDDAGFGKKISNEDARASPVSSKDSEEILRNDDSGSRARTMSPQRQPSKLQKQPRADMSAIKASNPGADPKSSENQRLAGPDRPHPAGSALEPSMRLVDSGDQKFDQSSNGEINERPAPQVVRDISPLRVNQPIRKAEDSLIQNSQVRDAMERQPKLESVKAAQERLDLDDSDASVEALEIDQPTRSVPDGRPPQRPTIPGAFPDSYSSTAGYANAQTAAERLSESPVQISPIDTSRSNPPALIVDTSSQEEPSSPVSSPSPELVEAEDLRDKKGSDNSSSTPTSTSTWSDAHLRSFFDDDTEIKDLLVVVYDKSGVIPAGPDHPITGNLFKEENAKLAEITNRLDNMLGDWLARKMKASSSR